MGHVNAPCLAKAARFALLAKPRLVLKLMLVTSQRMGIFFAEAWVENVAEPPRHSNGAAYTKEEIQARTEDLRRLRAYLSHQQQQGTAKRILLILLNIDCGRCTPLLCVTILCFKSVMTCPSFASLGSSAL